MGSYLRVAGISNRLLVDLKNRLRHPLQWGPMGSSTGYTPGMNCASPSTTTLRNTWPPPIEVPILFEDEDLWSTISRRGWPPTNPGATRTDSLGNAFAWHCQQMGLAISFPGEPAGQGHLWHCVGGQEPACCLPTERRGGEGVFRRGLRSRMEEDQGTVEAPIRRINEVYTKRMVSPDGQYAKTDLGSPLPQGGVFPAPAEALHLLAPIRSGCTWLHIGHPWPGMTCMAAIWRSSPAGPTADG